MVAQLAVNQQVKVRPLPPQPFIHPNHQSVRVVLACTPEDRARDAYIRGDD